MTTSTPPTPDREPDPHSPEAPPWHRLSHAYTERRLLFAPAPSLSPAQLHERRERVFLLLAGIFLGTLAMLNILGVTRFILLGSAGQVDGSWTFQFGQTIPGSPWVFAIAVGVLPYPITFLCTDLVSELFGRRRANFMVLVGLLLNLWVVFILWLGGALPGFEALDPDTGQLATDDAGRLPLFFELRTLAFSAVSASMIAYLAAQFCDVYLFHFWKKLTRGKHLWLRNNGSTIVSQLVDTSAVILITYAVGGLDDAIDPDLALATQLLILIATGYTIKLFIALLDTIPAYLLVGFLSRYLRINPRAEHHADAEQTHPQS